MLRRTDDAILRAFVLRSDRLTDVLARLRAAAFPAQRAFIDDPARLKSALCSRRSGKTFGAAGLHLLERAFAFPGTKHMYLALTRESAKRILWDDILKRLNRDLDLRLHFHETELSARTETGSVIYLLGADAKAEEQQKLLGQKYKTVVIDECASFRINLRTLVFRVLEPATTDERGTISMIGTPGDFTGPATDPHLFYAATDGTEPGWSRHRWTTFDNPHMADRWAEQIARMRERNPLFESTAEYKTEWLGQWDNDPKRRVYRFTEGLNLVEAAPVGLRRFVIATDLGFDDATAFVVCGWGAPGDGTLYLLRAFKRTKMILSDVATELNALRAAYGPAQLIVDGAAKQAVEHMRHVYGLPLQPADKAGKADFVRLMNTDLQTGHVRLVRGATDALIDEWRALVWDERARVPTELASCDNHCADAALYGWRAARHYLPPTPIVEAKSEQEAAIDAWLAKESRRIEADDEG